MGFNQKLVFLGIYGGFSRIQEDTGFLDFLGRFWIIHKKLKDSGEFWRISVGFLEDSGGFKGIRED